MQDLRSPPATDPILDLLRAVSESGSAVSLDALDTRDEVRRLDTEGTLQAIDTAFSHSPKPVRLEL